MAEVTKLAESPVLKVAIGFVQAMLVAAAVGAFNSVTTSLNSIQMQLGMFQTTVALHGQDIESLKISRDQHQKSIDDMRMQVQRNEIKIGVLTETPRLSRGSR